MPVAINNTKVRLVNHPIYRHALITEKEDGTIIYQLPERLPFIETDDIRVHTVQQEERLYDLAIMYYGKTRTTPWIYWEVIANFQPVPIIDPSVPLPEGSEIYIPSDSYIEEVALGPTLTDAPEL